jgi:hypothetical protein
MPGILGNRELDGYDDLQVLENERGDSMKASADRYNELFPDNMSKTRAFDKIAERYYYGNFGMMQKSDFETLMFSIYIEQILAKSEDDVNTYSDYELSKLLGISRAKVSNLKVKKQWQYPREFVWQEVFCKSCANARYIDGKIKIHIPDINLYNEIQNAIETNGGFVEVQRNRNLLQVTPESFLDIMKIVAGKDGAKAIEDALQKHQRENKEITDNIEKESFGKRTKGFLRDVAIEGIKGVATSLINPMGIASYIFSAFKAVANLF